MITKPVHRQSRDSNIENLLTRVQELTGGLKRTFSETSTMQNGQLTSLKNTRQIDLVISAIGIHGQFVNYILRCW